MTSTAHPEIPRFITMEELHAACGGDEIISVRTLQRMAHENKIPGAVKLGRKFVFQRLKVLGWLEGSDSPRLAR